MNNLIRAYYTANGGDSVAHNTQVAIDFETKVYDPYNLVTVGANWVFGAPKTGWYHIDVDYLYNGSTAWAEGEQASTYLSVNLSATPRSVIGYVQRDDTAGASKAVGSSGSTDIYLNSGDTLQVRAFQASGATQTIYSGGNPGYFNHIAIHYIG